MCMSEHSEIAFQITEDFHSPLGQERSPLPRDGDLTLIPGHRNCAECAGCGPAMLNESSLAISMQSGTVRLRCRQDPIGRQRILNTVNVNGLFLSSVFAAKRQTPRSADLRQV